jgi:hypothetical protein
VLESPVFVPLYFFFCSERRGFPPNLWKETGRRTAVGKLSLVCVSLLSLTLLGQDDVLKLKGGATFGGKILAETEKTVTLQFPGGTMEIKRDRILEIVRSARNGATDAPDAAPVLAGLTRFRDADEWFFLYQSGKRVGWRVVETRREIRRGVAGYIRRDRLVFTTSTTTEPDVDLNLMEFVDAEMRPLELAQRMTAGTTTRLVEGSRDGDQLKLIERAAGRVTERLAMFRRGVDLPGFLLKRLAVAPVPEGGYGAYHVFDPRDLEFAEVGLARTVERVNLHGQVLDVMIFRRKVGPSTLETWFDLAGRTVREEIGSRSLVAIATERSRVDAFASGDASSGVDDLGLGVACDEAGLKLERPDLSWEVQPGSAERNVLTSLIKAASRATVEVFEVRPKHGVVTEESAAFDILGRLQKSCDGFKLEGPTPQTIGQSDGLRFSIECKRRDSRLKTLGFIIPRDRRVFVVLCAAPTDRYGEVLPSFLRILQSIRVEKESLSLPPPDPHGDAEKELNAPGT